MNRPRSILARRAILLNLIPVLAISACGSAGEGATGKPSEPGDSPSATRTASELSSSFPMEIQNCDGEVVLEEPPESVLTIGTAAMRLLFAAGASEHIVARAGEFDAPLPAELGPSLSAVEVIDPQDPSTEKIIGSGADTVIGYGLFASTPEDLAAADITHLVVTGECGHDEGEAPPAVTFETVYDDIRRFGQIFQTADIAESNVVKLQERVEALRDEVEGGQQTSAAAVYYFSSSSELSAYGNRGIAHAQLSAAGLNNVLGEIEQNNFKVNLEELLDRDPQVLVLGYGLSGESFEEAKQRLLQEPGITDVAAVRDDRIIGVPTEEIAPDPAAIDGLERIITELRQTS